MKSTWKNMGSCEDIKPQVGLYLDGELHAHELGEMEVHLDRCGTCRGVVDEERRWLEAIRSADFSQRVPDRLRQKVEFLVQRECGNSRKRRLFRFSRIAAAAILIIGMALVLGQMRGGNSGVQVDDFTSLAVDSHLRQLGGKLPLEIASSSADTISSWFTGKVDFKLQLPNYQDISGQQPLYHLNGARLVSFNNKYVAYVAYQMQGKLISLVVTSNLTSLPEGGRTVDMKGLKFHFTSRDGLKVITWSDHGLTYALVSDGAELGQQSCIVCHTGAKDRELIDNIRP